MYFTDQTKESKKEWFLIGYVVDGVLTRSIHPEGDFTFSEVFLREDGHTLNLEAISEIEMVISERHGNKEATMISLTRLGKGYSEDFIDSSR